MNPFMLLIGPATAVGMFIIKMFVAAGFWVSNQFALLPHDGSQPGVAVYAQAASAEDPDQVVVRLSSGELFHGAVARQTAATAPATPGWGAVFAAAPPPHALAAPLVRVELTSASGRTMTCAFSGDRGNGNRTAGSCRAQTGETFDLTL